MRSSRRLACRTVLAGLVTLGICLPQVRVTEGQTNTVAVVGADRLALRRGPGKDFAPFDSLKAGTRVEIEEIEGEWARVITPSGRRGYVHGNFLQIPGEPLPAAAAPAIQSPPPAPAATVPRPTERKRLPPTPSPTRTPKKRVAATATPSSTATRQPAEAAATATTTGDRSRQLTEEVSTLSARNAALERDLRAALDALAAVRSNSAATPPPAAAQVSEELTRLTATVEALQKQLEAQPARAGAPGADVRQGLSGGMVGAGVLGIAVGWLLGTALGRRSDRSRRTRIRF